MKASELQNDLHLFMECELVRYTLKDDLLDVLVVADNEECDHDHDHEEEEEEECEEDGCCHDDCCEGLNGHLFRFIFHGVTDFTSEGEECDNYKTLVAKADGNHLHLEFEGINMIEDNSDVMIDFSFRDFEVMDEGEIKSPEV